MRVESKRHTNAHRPLTSHSPTGVSIPPSPPDFSKPKRDSHLRVSLWSQFADGRRKCGAEEPFLMPCPFANDGLHLCETAIHEQFRSRDVATVIGCEKHHSLGDLIGCTEAAERKNVGNHLPALLAPFY